MNVTPNTLVSQVARARAERVVPFGGDRLAFTSQTGVVRVVPQNIEPNVWDVDDAHCFVCSRHTDHFAEHDDLVEQGFAQYEQDGSVTWTEKGWNEFRG
jgi:hypothetical protein